MDQPDISKLVNIFFLTVNGGGEILIIGAPNGRIVKTVTSNQVYIAEENCNVVVNWVWIVLAFPTINSSPKRSDDNLQKKKT